MNSIRPGPASYDSRGTRYVFVAPAQDERSAYALDVEDKDQPGPAFLARRLGSMNVQDALRTWTEIEVAAKLLDEPSLSVFNRYATTGRLACERDPAIIITRLDTGARWVAVGRQER